MLIKKIVNYFIDLLVLLGVIRLEKAIPAIFSIETSLNCNLKCPECAIGNNLITREHNYMSFEQFKEIADKIKPFASRIEMIYLHLWGEPMLNADIIKIIQYASSFARTNISTNGLSLSYEKAEELIKSGVNSIIVSIDGTSQEVYEKYRVGGSLKKALDALKTLQKLNIKYNKKVKIIPQFIVFRHNEHEMAEFKEICNFMGLSPCFKSPYIRPNSIFFESTLKKYLRKRFRSEALLKKAMRFCQDPRKVFTILLDGTVVACCYDHNKVTNFGNIFSQDVLGIWRSSKFLDFRRKIMAGNAPGFCVENCLLYRLDNPADKK